MTIHERPICDDTVGACADNNNVGGDGCSPVCQPERFQRCGLRLPSTFENAATTAVVVAGGSAGTNCFSTIGGALGGGPGRPTVIGPGVYAAEPFPLSLNVSLSGVTVVGGKDGSGADLVSGRSTNHIISDAALHTAGEALFFEVGPCPP